MIAFYSEPGGTIMLPLNEDALTDFLGAMLQFAYCLNDPFDFASNAVEIEIVP